MEKTLIYHYTSLSHLIEIFKTGKLLTSQTEKMLKVKKPGLWFSSNSNWEPSAFKRFNDGKKEFDLNTPEEFEKYIGCARIITKLNPLFVTFAKYKHKSKVNPLLWEKMAEIGKSKGSDTNEWYATFNPLSINSLDIEVYENGNWISLKKENGEFDTELFNRNLEKTFVYKRGKEMEEKMMEELKKQNPEANKENDNIEKVIEEKAEEVIEEKAEEVIEEKVEEVIEEKAEEVIEEKVEEVIEEKVEEVIEEKLEEVIEEKAEEVIEEKVEEVIEEKVEEVIEEKAEEVIDKKAKEKSKGIFSSIKNFFGRK